MWVISGNLLSFFCPPSTPAPLPPPLSQTLVSCLVHCPPSYCPACPNRTYYDDEGPTDDNGDDDDDDDIENDDAGGVDAQFIVRVLIALPHPLTTLCIFAFLCLTNIVPLFTRTVSNSSKKGHN